MTPSLIRVGSSTLATIGLCPCGYGKSLDPATARHALTAKATLDLVTTRTLIEALALIGIEWSPVSFNQMMRTSGEGPYTWVIEVISTR